MRLAVCVAWQHPAYAVPPCSHAPVPCLQLQAKADAQVRWAVLNVVTLLRRHERVHDALADAMQQGASVGECIAVIERQLAGAADI